MTLVEYSQLPFDRRVRRGLKLRIERRVHLEPIFIQRPGAVRVLEMLPYFLDEVGRERLQLRGSLRQHDLASHRRVRFSRCDVAVVGHLTQHVVASRTSLIWVEERALTPGALENAGDHCRFSELQLERRLSEVEARGGFDAVCAATEIHLVAVEGEDLALGIALFDLDSEDRLVDLPDPELFQPERSSPVE